MRSIRAGGTVIKDPNAEEVFEVTWDEHLNSSVLITSHEFFIVGTDLLLTKDNEGIVLPAARSAQLRLKGGTLGVSYTITHRIVTNEAIPQTKDASFRVVIRER